jgi:hypothetical protein
MRAIETDLMTVAFTYELSPVLFHKIVIYLMNFEYWLWIIVWQYDEYSQWKGRSWVLPAEWTTAAATDLGPIYCFNLESRNEQTDLTRMFVDNSVTPHVMETLN